MPLALNDLKDHTDFKKKGGKSQFKIFSAAKVNYQ